MRQNWADVVISLHKSLVVSGLYTIYDRLLHSKARPRSLAASASLSHRCFMYFVVRHGHGWSPISIYSAVSSKSLL